MHSRRASSLFFFCLPGWFASEFNCNRSGPVAFPEPSALVMESRVVVLCTGALWGVVFFPPLIVAEAHALVLPRLIRACALKSVGFFAGSGKIPLKEVHNTLYVKNINEAWGNRGYRLHGICSIGVGKLGRQLGLWRIVISPFSLGRNQPRHSHLRDSH